MEQLRNYVITVVAAAVICAVINALMDKKGTHGAIVKMLTGLFLTVAVLSPWVSIRISDWNSFSMDLEAAAGEAVAVGEEMAADAMKGIIKEKAEAYILDKAASMAINIEVEVMLDSADLPLPEKVYLKGSASPYAKERLCQCIAADLGIPEEKQIWT